MRKTTLFNCYLENLLEGKRQGCQTLVWEALERGNRPDSLYYDLLWPAMEQVDRLYRDDNINTAVEHMATRINRHLADQIQRDLERRQPNGKRLLITCANAENEELGAQMCTDLFEAAGWDVYFVGGGVPNDEVLSLVGKLRPHVMLVYGMAPKDVPGTRALIDLIRDVGANPTMNIMLSGGVFNRAEDLWKEINADLFAPTAKEALAVAKNAEPREPEIRIPGAPKKRRRRRRPPLLTEYENSKR